MRMLNCLNITPQVVSDNSTLQKLVDTIMHGGQYSTRRFGIPLTLQCPFCPVYSLLAAGSSDTPLNTCNMAHFCLVHGTG